MGVGKQGPWTQRSKHSWVSIQRNTSPPERSSVTSSSAYPTVLPCPSLSQQDSPVPMPRHLSFSLLASPKSLPVPSPWDSAGILSIPLIASSVLFGYWENAKIIRVVDCRLLLLSIFLTQISGGEKRGWSLYEGAEERTRGSSKRSWYRLILFCYKSLSVSGMINENWIWSMKGFIHTKIAEAAEVAEILAEYGVEPHEYTPVVNALRKNPKAWVDFMMK